MLIKLKEKYLVVIENVITEKYIYLFFIYSKSRTNEIVALILIKQFNSMNHVHLILITSVTK